MASTHRASSRALITTAAAVALFSATLSLSPATAWAHVHVDAQGAAPGSTSVLTFRVPGESETGALTTVFSVALPDVTSARTELMPGWTARLDRDAGSGTVRSVTWTAAPAVGISSDQFGLFRVSVTLPDAESVTLPATQTYSDGAVVTWDQPPLPGGGEPEHPAPVLTLTAGAGEAEHDHGPTASAAAAPPAAAPPATAAPAADDTARWLAGAALVVGALGVAAALFRGRRA
ncbi:YcnI family copper-binding membrane protein [Mycolicibacterium arenosum]|uniref:YcnI family protein n=1 Tax=Mycolicibacterium arenosum TaxID=2952157 RepID=A0ABT1MC54_9MYCO|nr:YcnI family protein [Mycolicibacterium sp. CAU 1645]MCP9275774.1 YcnI family protein [Mycolicibacterium sp. CAU 1645]